VRGDSKPRGPDPQWTVAGADGAGGTKTRIPAGLAEAKQRGSAEGDPTVQGSSDKAVGELLFPTRVVHVSDYTQSGVITRAVHLVGKVSLVGNGKGLRIIWLVGNRQDP
jgi:hypothetical protein